MRPRERRFGLGCALVTPFAANGEGASIGFGERAAMLDALRAAGVDMSRHVLAGIAASAIEDAAAQANQLFDAGGRGVLLAPPFYFKGPGDEGLFRWFAAVLERCRSPRDVILYHIPSVTLVPLSSALVGRIDRAFPGVVGGVKDSSGDWATTEQLLADHPHLHILVGDERLLARNMRHGGSGAINGFANFCARQLLPMVEDGTDVSGIAALVDIVLQYPVTPAVKALVAHRYGDDGFLATAPPLEPVGAAAQAELGAALDRLLAA